MLKMLSGKTHHVVTGVCLTTQHKQPWGNKVTFKPLSDDRNQLLYKIIISRLTKLAPIWVFREWIGYIGCTGLKGVILMLMGLPVSAYL